ncbi:ATP-binding protein [Pseudomonas sp. 10B1]|uniref:ATP-binding protein n=1 Tax=unclassified Pseudomonas TaxID=196821 RepID=UPI002B234D4B|nr:MULTISPECIES: ATP-binding protein [unclassified Pseudomonas]MEA9977854.1 ATP-binding protein [Pseudomonas sp. RTS4]MEA9992899.1 ATP-binding protein [Pseudomonas sp. AA4]MEB0089074.1 ATP-binding protein [Pseudomonas sp. RTI1]MEB0125723.1 ATP-binding protein [Pseudomonas sp. CCC1.2]MEB0151484.1 ATP-binding protein [Pseudomonas sp. CCC4.3]
MDLNLRSCLTEVLLVEDSSQVGFARRTAQKLAEQIGFDATEAGRVALVVTELASNLLKHAGRGELHLRILPRDPHQGLEVLAIDRGPGFDLQACLADGYSTGGTQGIGLGAVSRQADVFDVYSDSRGAVLLARFFRRLDKAADYRIGVSQHSLHNDSACGDVWALSFKGPRISALIIDGLGHGEDAQVAGFAGASSFAQNPLADPLFSLEDMHHAMQGTRGGAVAVAQFDQADQRLRFVGIGNISASIVSAEKSRGMASHPGIVGLRYRKAQVFEFSDVSGHLLIMHSDGLQSRWNLRDYPGLMLRHPAIIAALLHRDYCRGRDDITVLVVALENPHV